MCGRWIVILVAMLVAGCGMAPEEYTDDSQSSSPGVYVSDEFLDCVMAVQEIEYVGDRMGADAWQTPAETVRRGKGDCEDVAIYFQHLLRAKGIHAELVFGLLNIQAKVGHVWCEADLDGVRYIIEPGRNAYFRKASLPSFLYVRADEIESVAEKVRAYHEKTGVWVSSSYREFLERP